MEPAVVRRASASSSGSRRKAYKMHIRVLLSKLPRLHAVPGLRRRAAEARGAAVAPRHAGDADAVLRRAALSPDGVRGRRAARALPGLRARPDAAADRPHARVLRALQLPRRSTKRPTCCSTKSARGFATCATSASATSRSTASRARSPAARCSASTSRPRSAPRSSTRCSCSTSRRSACTRATWAASSR